MIFSGGGGGGELRCSKAIILNFFQVLGFLENTLNVSQEILDKFRNEKVSVHYILVKLCLKIHLITSVWFFVCHLLILFVSLFVLYMCIWK